MKKKIDKVLWIIFICLFVALCTAIAVLYAINPDMVKEWFEYIIDLLNRPLPIVGITSAAVLIFLWQVIVRVRFGKSALNQYEQKYQDNRAMILEEKQNIAEERKEIAQERKDNRAMIGELRNQLVEVCKTIPNLKVNELGKKIEKESVDNEQEKIDSSSEKE